MLMPSALSCEASQPPVTRLQSSALFASPPASPPSAPQTTIGNIFNSCRALQSMLASPVSISQGQGSMLYQLPTPPLAHAALPSPSPMKLRLRTRKSDNDKAPRKKVTKRTAPPRGVNKRRRAAADDMGRDDFDSDVDVSSGSDREQDDDLEHKQPSTPKRARIAPEILPMGLERSDFHILHTNSQQQPEPKTEGHETDVDAGGEEWSWEDDRVLVELVLEKLKLSKTEWQDCARSLGKDRNSVGRRWKSLMGAGDVGLKSRNRRAKLHGTWR